MSKVISRLPYLSDEFVFRSTLVLGLIAVLVS